MRKFTIFVELFWAEVNVTVINSISVTFFNKSAYDIDDFVDVFSCLWMNSCFTHIHTLCICPEFFNILFRNCFVICSFFICTTNDFIVNVSKVLNKIHLISTIFHISSECVKHAKRTSITDMDIVINCRSASVNLQFVWCNCFKFFFSSCESVKNFHITHLFLPFLYILKVLFQVFQFLH